MGAAWTPCAPAAAPGCRSGAASEPVSRQQKVFEELKDVALRTFFYGAAILPTSAFHVRL